MNSKSIVLTPSHLLPASSRCDDNKDAYVLQFASDVQIGIRFYVVTLHLRFSLSLIHTHVSYIYLLTCIYFCFWCLYLKCLAGLCGVAIPAVRTLVCLFIHTLIHTCTYSYIRSYIHALIHTYVHIHAHTHIYIYHLIGCRNQRFYANMHDTI